MLKAIKVRLYPTKEQELLLWESANVARFSYNWGLAYSEEYYRQNKKSIKIGDLRKQFTVMRNSEGCEWLKRVSSEIPQQALKDLGEAFNKFFKKQGEYPKFKSKKNTDPSFYNLTNKIKVNEDRVWLEKIGNVKMNDEKRLPLGDYRKDKIKVYNPRVKYNGKYWYLSVSIDFQQEEVVLSGESIGIDLGIKELAVVSNIEKHFININKSKRVIQLKRRLKRLQRKVSRKYVMNKDGKKFVKTNNIIKLEKEIKLISKKIRDIRINHIHQVTNSIVKTKPSRVVMEDLDVKGMMKNKHLSKAVQEQCFYKFISTMKYKCEWNGIEFIQAYRFYPSSKKCSSCGNVKSDLKLSDRTYKCCCGLVIDRDKNASINLARYKLVP